MTTINNMRTYKTEAIIVKRKNFGEADRILTVLTPNYGKIKVRAPGVRKITSRRSSHIELLNLTTFTLYKNPHALFPIVTEAQAQEEFLSIKKTLTKIGFAYYICELIDTLCAEREENRRIFFLARDTLFQLASDKLNDSIQELRHRRSGDPSPHPLSLREKARVRGQARMTESAKALSVIDVFEDELLVALGFLPRYHKVYDKRAFIESILEKKLSTRRLLPLFLNNNEG